MVSDYTKTQTNDPFGSRIRVFSESTQRLKTCRAIFRLEATISTGTRACGNCAPIGKATAP